MMVTALAPTWANWSGSVSCTPQTLSMPASERELIDLIKQTAAGSAVRVAGSGHSFVPLCTTNGLLITLDGLQGVISIDQGTLRATVWAGSKIHQLGAPLAAAGLVMENMGDIDRQSIAGAIATGTHGTGRTLGNISTQIVALRLVTATGDVLDCSEEVEPHLFKATQVSLGALGVITRVTLRLLPAYRLHERTWVASFDECMANLAALIDANRHFEFFWSPSEDACALKTLNPTTLAAPPRHDKAPVTGRLARYINEDRIDAAYRIFPSQRTIRFNETEFALPAAAGPDCLCEVRRLMQTKYQAVAWPVEYRTLHADDIYISPAYGRDTVTISVHQAAELAYRPFFSDVEAVFRNHRGRPHWGKLHTHTARELRDLYPMWDCFQAARRQLDPAGQFMNGYLHALFDD